jgi:hypothetical protein
VRELEAAGGASLPGGSVMALPLAPATGSVDGSVTSAGWRAALAGGKAIGAGSALPASAGGISTSSSFGASAGARLSVATASRVRGFELFFALALEPLRALAAERLRAWAVPFLALGSDRLRAFAREPLLLSATGS